jgi:hypothetical protein
MHRKERKKVRRTQLFTSLLILIVAVAAFVGFAPLQAQQQAAKITVMNPAITNKMVNRMPLSPRLDTLDGKTLYLVDISWGGPEAAYPVFEEIQSWFSQNKPSVKVVIKRKTGMYSMDDRALWQEIKKNGNAAMIGISG